jgi:hypothetical protein
MSKLAHSVGQSTTSLLDGAQHLLEDSYYATKVASSAFSWDTCPQLSITIGNQRQLLLRFNSLISYVAACGGWLWRVVQPRLKILV